MNFKSVSFHMNIAYVLITATKFGLCYALNQWKTDDYSHALGAVEAMSDRVCIHSKGQINFRFSAEDLVSCCGDCGFGCGGGFLDQAWMYWVNFGIVSGGAYDSHQGCQPYEIEPCEHHVNGSRKPCSGGEPTPQCEKQCKKSYDVPYDKDLHYDAEEHGNRVSAHKFDAIEMDNRTTIHFIIVGVHLIVNFINITSAAPPAVDPLSDEFIDYINRLNSTWKAARNFRSDIPTSHFRRLMGVIKTSNSQKLPRRYHNVDEIQLPENFDSRDQWPDCPTIKEIRDQGSCGSCWAFGAVEAMSDRVCIHSKGQINFRFSAQDLVSCCDDCGSGCKGGDSYQAWNYWVTFGIVSGGAYDSHQGCQPYETEPCEHHSNGSRVPCSGEAPTPRCEKQCKKSYDVPYEKDLHYGVYQYLSGSFLGGHAIRMLGWGVDSETGTPYWLCANSWNSDWGDNGFFRILRGKDEFLLPIIQLLSSACPMRTYPVPLQEEAARNFRSDIPTSHFRRLMGVIKTSNSQKLPRRYHNVDEIQLPENFDSRDQWPDCPTIKEIRDQGSCGSCWAFGAVEAMSDRVCIHSKGQINFRFSAQDLVSCCDECGSGCNGGDPYQAWDYWVNFGIVSGGAYDSHQGCQPYETEPCEHHSNGSRVPCSGEAPTPRCEKQCKKSYDVPYEKDLHYVTNSVISKNLLWIKYNDVLEKNCDFLFHDDFTII
ncbi:hypothetical protein C0J52_14918 [Blattella germanica]|nr:hypothetical protein C0J52_14918 [Blattella germanica]